MSDWHDVAARLGLATIINAAGTMTALGASAASADAIAAAASILPLFVSIDELQRRASDAIASATGAEAGCVTACAAAGLTLGVAATMSGVDPGAIARLPDTSDMRNEVLVQAGHLVDYGAPIEQTVRLAGARAVTVGGATEADSRQLRAALTEQTCAGLYVVSHHCVQRGQIPLVDFIRICHGAGIPVIVDAASEYNLRLFSDQGADLVVYSAHKFLAGLTAGIVAGRSPLVRACYLQHQGIGRPMKVGKEGIAATIAALDAWDRRDHDAVRRAEEARTALWLERLPDEGIAVTRSPDPTGNPISRARVQVQSAAVGCAAWDLARALAAGTPAIVVRTDGINLGYFELDPCNLSDEQAATVARRIQEIVSAARAGNIRHTAYGQWCEEVFNGQHAWPNATDR